MDNAPTWQQVNIAFPEWSRAEQTALTFLSPLLCAVEDEGAVNAWFLIRKRPCWRVRYLAAGTAATARVGRELDALEAAGHIAGWTTAIYEPEVHAFGGVEAMAAAHRLFHRDSRSLLAHLQGPDQAAGGHRREMSVMLCSILMRSAGLDWYEQGDVWARVAEHRVLPTTAGSHLNRLQAAVERLITVDAEDQTREDGPLAHAAGWARAYTTAGQELAQLAASGALHRGLRGILAHHVLFAWNRIGLPYDTQAVLAATAKIVVFGPDATVPSGTEPAETRVSSPVPLAPRGTV
ncbi:thiopeptide-type bacteriocin biosynthesis protein [Actinacidiphila acididurans]|uniref:Thiopeptide-type bacteriocin biosynthesis protein n=1 Tax=Actinacidiphila acididurans TaxID=2784346 RepID=A0ABS2TVD9_9ACTN|nr:thiopeptide-type bacteriocin biosynthesis protein [Actinacidiphila acididurans]MBM9506767.1 thiopeptide-type bacteriocin biosynthesis protein [Actinacidiphila acididurans]